MGEGFKGTTLKSDGSAQGCYSSEPKGSAVLGVLSRHQREEAQGAMRPESYCGLGICSWSVCCGGMGQGDPHPCSCGLSSLLVSQWRLACETAGADYLCV